MFKTLTLAIAVVAVAAAAAPVHATYPISANGLTSNGLSANAIEAHAALNGRLVGIELPSTTRRGSLTRLPGQRQPGRPGPSLGRPTPFVMAGLDPAIHVSAAGRRRGSPGRAR